MIIGENKGKGYYAMWCNESTVYTGDTPEEAMQHLLREKYPGIWNLNDKDKDDVIINGLGACKKWVKRGDA
jgi:hypothetical protein